MSSLDKIKISIILVFVKSKLTIPEDDTLLITYYKTTILCTCSFALFKFLAPLPGIDFFLFLPISIQSNLGFNLELYFISSIYIYIFFSKCVFYVVCAVLELETLFLLIRRLKELLSLKERKKY